MVLMEHMGWKLCRKQWTGTTDQLIEDLEAAYRNDLKAFCSKLIFYKCGALYLFYFRFMKLGQMYVSSHVDIFDMVDIDLFIVVALNMMVLKLGYIGKSEPMYYNYLRPLTSLDEGLYALTCEEDIRCLDTLVRSFKLIEVYIEHGVTTLDSYLRAPRFRTTLEEITDEPGSIAENITEKILLLTWHESSETPKELVCDSVTPSSLTQHDSSRPCKDSVCESITPRCMLDCNLTPPTDESVTTYTQLSGVQGVDTQSHAGFADVARSGVDSSGLSHDESFGVDDLDLNLNEPVKLNVSQVETQSDLPVSEEPDVGRTQEPILVEVSTQKPIVAKVSTQGPIVAEVSIEVPIVEEVGTQEFSVEDVVLEDYVSYEEDAERYNGRFDESALSDGRFFFDDERMDTEYDVQSSEDASTNDDDDVDEYFLVDEENKIIEPDVDVYLFGISMDLPFDNIGVTNLVSDDVLEGENVDVINADGFNNDPDNDEETNYRKRRLAELRTEIEGVTNASGKWKRNLKLYKNDGVRIRARCDGKVPVFTISQDIPVKAVQDQLQRELEVQISMSKAFKANAKAKREIKGDHVLQYSTLRDYVVELQFTNPNIIVKIAVERNTDPSLPTRGPFPGQVLAAVGLDSNNGIYPLAYALVEAESKSSWCWFLQCLGDDIDLHPNSNFTFISDKQKGIIPAIKIVYLSRAKSDLLLNNICEVFNGKIVGGKDKPVIAHLEYISEYCMKRIMNVEGVIDKCTGPLTPTATRIMESIKKEAHLMKVQWMEQISIKFHIHLVISNTTPRNMGKSLLLVEYMEGNLLSQDTTNLWDQVLKKSTYLTTLLPPKHHVQVGRSGKKRKRSKHEDEPFMKEEPLHVNHVETLDTIRQDAKDKVANG
nr:hypothetical protein [Tanacetum cinerariifolium]